MLGEWSACAIDGRETIFDYIETASPQNAAVVNSRIELHVERLAQFPEMGRPGRVENTRELIVRRTPFIVAYQIEGDSLCRFCVFCTGRSNARGNPS